VQKKSECRLKEDAVVTYFSFRNQSSFYSMPQLIIYAVHEVWTMIRITALLINIR